MGKNKSEITSKSKLAVAISQLKGYEKPNIKLEQYQTDSEIAAEILWTAYMAGFIQEKRVLDLGAGTGILGIGAALLGASECILLDKDRLALKTAKQNIDDMAEKGILLNEEKIQLIESEVSDFDGYSNNYDTSIIDTIVMNPPFGAQNKNADRQFLDKAMDIAEHTGKGNKCTNGTMIYSLHMAETKDFLISYCEKRGFACEAILQFNYPLKSSYSFHKKRIHNIEVICLKIYKKAH